MFFEHAKRVIRSTSGFTAFGAAWLFPWIAYIFSPLITRLVRNRIWKFSFFFIRTDQGDLYTYANLFEDYPVDYLKSILPQVELVVDAGANAGAFSCLVQHLAEQSGLHLKIVSLEPVKENAALLKSQPFADKITILEAAIGPDDGAGVVQRGINSVTHSIDFSSSGGAEENVQVYSLQTLCDRPALVKMDIEGGEYAVLKNGLPSNVKFLLLEWHPSALDDRPADPTSLITTGRWTLVSRDIYGSSMWLWQSESR